MDLKTWLKEQKISTNKFSEMIGCSRQITWKACRGIPICPKYAKKIYDLTDGKIKPNYEFVGKKPVFMNTPTFHF